MVQNQKSPINSARNNAKNNKSLWQKLHHSLEQDLPTTSELLGELQAERQSLETRNYDEFQKVIVRKQALVNTLEKHANDRQTLLSSAGFIDESATLNIVEQEAPAVASIWRKLGEQWQQCQDLNAVNERIAQRTSLVVGQILDLLRGQNSQQKLYTDKGNTTRSSGGRTITSA